MNQFDFDKEIDRRGSGDVKDDALATMFGRADLLPLWVADMDFEVCPAIWKSLEKRIAHHIYGYGAPSDGYWQAIIDWESKEHDFKIAREELTYVPGVVKGVALAVNHFTKKGDKIVIQQPVYFPFKNVTVGNGRICVNNALIHDGDNYSMDFEGLEKILTEQKPKMMILCNPHNPIGISWSKEVLARLAKMCKAHGVTVVSDEIHGDLTIFGHKHTPFATACEEAAEISVTFGAPSKTFNIPGLVSSWCVVKNEKLRKPFFEWMEANEFNAPTFVATIATEAAYKFGKEWLEELKEYIEGNIRYVEEFCKENLPEIHPVRPQASFLVWLDCTKLKLDHEQLNRLFIDQARLALNDGEMFGPGGECHERLNVASPRKVMERAMEQLLEAVKTVRK
jgi:cystathionine beta-lyase